MKVGLAVDQMTTAVGYASSSDYGVHFGLGAAKTIDRMEIRVAERHEAGARERGGGIRVLTMTEPDGK